MIHFIWHKRTLLHSVGVNSPGFLLSMHWSCFYIYCCIMPNEELDNQSWSLSLPWFPKLLCQQVGYKEQPPQKLPLAYFPTLQIFIAGRKSSLCCLNMQARGITKVNLIQGRNHLFWISEDLIWHRNALLVHSNIIPLMPRGQQDQKCPSKSKSWLPRQS